MKAELFAVDRQAQVRYVQVASAAYGTNDGDGRPCLVARYGGILTALRGGYFGSSRPFGWPGMPFVTLTRG